MSYQPQHPGQPAQAAPAYAASGAPGPGEPFDGANDVDDLTRPLYGATFGQAVKRFFKNYAKFTGRASRSEYWYAQLLGLLLQLVPIALVAIGGISAAGSALGGTSTDAAGNTTLDPAAAAAATGSLGLMAVGYVLMTVIGLALLVPTLAISWRRLHDANLAGPFWFLSLTTIGGIVVLVFMILPSKPEGRRFDAP